MNEFWPFIVSGIATGSVYGLAGTGLVLTYKTSGIFNFAQGAIATAAAYFFYFLHVDQGYDWKVSFFLAVFVAGPLMGLVMERIGRQLSFQRTAFKIVATVGIILFVQSLAAIKYGSDTLRVEQYLPKGVDTFRVGGVNVTYAQLWVTIISVVAVVLLYLLFRRTRMGIAMRAVVDDPDLVAMHSTSPIRVNRTSWIIGCTFAALAGVLVLPFIGLNAIALTFLVVQAFGGAAVGAFSSIPLTFVGCLLIAIVADISKKYVLDVTWLSGLPESLPFIVLFGALLVLPRRKLVPPSTIVQRPHLPWRAPTSVRAGAGALVLIPLVLIPHLVSSAKLGFFTIGLTQVIMILSLGLLVRTSGQVSLAQATFAAIGAVAFSQLAVGQGLPWFLALVLGSLVVVPVGVFLAIPAIRLSGLFLALATFGFGIMVERMLYARSFMFTFLANGRPMPRPSFALDDTSYYYLVLAFVVVTAIVMVSIHRSRLGRVLRGMSETPTAVATLGLSTNTTRTIVFCISSFFAAMGGILYGASINFATSGDAYFRSFNSLVLLAMLALAPFAEPWYALIAGIAAVIPGYIKGANTTLWLNAIFGFLALAVALRGGHPSMPVRLQQFLERLGPRPKTPGVEAAPAASTPAAPAASIPAAPAASIPAAPAASIPAAPAASIPAAPAAPAGQERAGLEVHDLTVSFGGLLAVQTLTFEAPLGRVTGLIGPNGAGKTTTFDACSGLNRRVHGRVFLHGEDVTKLGPASRGRRGLGRTFQRMELGDALDGRGERRART